MVLVQIQMESFIFGSEKWT